MPLEPVPPPSPRGKTPPPKHQCSPTVPCPLRLSEVGRQYHQFPKGTFRAHFSPPALPKTVASHFAKNPPIWTWSVKAGPNEGKSFQVPTIPIACDKTAPRAVKWIVAVFHSFKAHLNPVALDTDSGRVLPAWLRLYQNNLLVHIRNQLKARLPRKVRSTPRPPSSMLGGIAAVPPAPVTDRTPPLALHAELSSLKEKLYNYISTHEACCRRSDSPANSSDEEAASEDGDPSDPQATSPPTFQLLVQRADGVSVPDPNPPNWLTTVLSRIDLPTSYTGALYSPEQLTPHLPRGATDVLKLHFRGSPPFCLVVCNDRSLHAVDSAFVDRGSISTRLSLPPDPTVPTARPR
ncbi:hypothetical protein EDD16DRAFT_1721413 [Pisolithus croceorrhizus]|nr:hypothetical protein EDD16DRAFT_1721413 [Pisolithus croceorrhizus]